MVPVAFGAMVEIEEGAETVEEETEMGGAAGKGARRANLLTSLSTLWRRLCRARRT
jgi:hypothetical protein